MRSTLGRATSSGGSAEAGAVSRIVKDDGIHLAVGAPVLAGDRLVAVAYVRLPLALATTALKSANVGSGTYLALRQGTYTLAERGDVALADSAEFLSATIEGRKRGAPDVSALRLASPHIAWMISS